MPWRRISAAQWLVLVPVIIKSLAWFLLMMGSILKVMGYGELASVVFAVSSALGLADAHKEVANLKEKDRE